MKKIFILFAAIITMQSVHAQAPEKISYQAVIRNASDQLIRNQTVGMRLSILKGSINGTSVYVERQTPLSNDNGLVSLAIGGGTVISGNFSTINWGNGPYFLKREIDPTGGTNYTISGTSELLSVPYALYSKYSKNANYANYADSANYADYANLADSANYANLADSANYASYANLADSANYANNANHANTVTSYADGDYVLNYVWEGRLNGNNPDTILRTTANWLGNRKIMLNGYVTLEFDIPQTAITNGINTGTANISMYLKYNGQTIMPLDFKHFGLSNDNAHITLPLNFLIGNSTAGNSMQFTVEGVENKSYTAAISSPGQTYGPYPIDVKMNVVLSWVEL